MTIKPIDRAIAGATDARDERELVAYEVSDTNGMEVRPAPKERRWMDELDEGFAYRCLPLVLANQAGWVIPSPTRVTIRWNGGDAIKDTRLWFPKNGGDERVLSHFGGGVVTFCLPYLFRTPPGINLWVKGPSNHVKDGVQPLEGVVESDWTEATFTMNWRMTRANHAVRFAEGEPICMIVPVPRGLVESLRPRSAPISEDPELEALHVEWSKKRDEFNVALARFDEAAVRVGWQRHYMQGVDIAGERFPAHQTRLDVKEFQRE